MPALANPRHEAFAQAIFQGLSQDPQPELRTGASRETFSNGKAYKRAGYLPSNTNAADAAASRLLRKVKPILERVRELQAEATKRLQPKLDLSRERIGRDLDQASRIAAEQKNASAMVASVLGIAKVFHGAQTALFAALSDGHGYSQGKAYRAAGYLAKRGASADSAASSRLRKFKGILDRVRELVAEANAAAGRRRPRRQPLSHARLNSITTMIADLFASLSMIAALLALLELARWLCQ